MQFVCRSAIALALFSTSLIACGGDDGGGNNTPMPDAKVFMDAATDMAAACVIPATVPGGTLGSDASRQSANWIRKNMSGQYIFSLTIPLDMTMKNIVTFAVVRQGTSWTVNSPINFDPNPTNQSAVAAAFMREGYDSMTGAATKYLWASSGSITFTEIAQTTGANITFSTTAANYREVNPMTGADVAGGCASMMGAVQGFVKQMTNPDMMIVQPGDFPPGDWRNELLEMPVVLAPVQ